MESKRLVSGVEFEAIIKLFFFLTEDEMQVIMQNFELQTLPGFPRIIRVIDGTHIRIKPPVKQPEAYVNRKKFHSFNTQVRHKSMNCHDCC